MQYITRVQITNIFLGFQQNFELKLLQFPPIIFLKVISYFYFAIVIATITTTAIDILLISFLIQKNQLFYQIKMCLMRTLALLL